MSAGDRGMADSLTYGPRARVRNREMCVAPTQKWKPKCLRVATITAEGWRVGAGLDGGGADV